MQKLDRYEEALLQKTKELKECQRSKNLDSCLKCQMIVGCRLRNEYVDAVYKSMNKGKGGGFEF